MKVSCIYVLHHKNFKLYTKIQKEKWGKKSKAFVNSSNTNEDII